MPSFFEDPALYRWVLEHLPMGLYILDREQKVRLWNKGAEEITGFIAHEVTGQVCRESLPHCDPQGRVLAGDDCSITNTLRDGRAARSHVFTLHKHGHRLNVEIQTLPLVDEKGVTMGVAVAFEESSADANHNLSGGLMCGCLDAVTGVAAHRLTKALLLESLIDLKSTHRGWGLLHVRILGLQDMARKYGADSIAPFLRTAGQTIRHSLQPEDFVGRWQNEEFVAIVQTSSPVRIAAISDLISLQLGQSEVTWWGDRFRVRAMVEWSIATAESTLENLLGQMKPEDADQSTTRSAAARAASTRG
jgi:PAS domain S-box-containing protein